MPVVSKNQNAAMHAAAQGQSTLGIPQNVGQKFVDASHGMNVSALPQQVPQQQPKKLPHGFPPKKKKAPKKGGGFMKRHSEHWS